MGEATTEVFIENNQYDLDQFINKSIILHSDADDLISPPSGNSGERIACGIITKSTVK